jgi:capsular polysaccharide biosynthesis protein
MKIKDNDEIDLLAIIKTIWLNKQTLIISIGVGLLLGLFFAIFTPKEYTAYSVMVPQLSGGSKTTQLSTLAALAGVDMSMTPTSDLSPLVYPQIVNSVPFKLELMNTPIQFKKLDHPVSMYDYYVHYNKPNVIGVLKKYTIGLPTLVLKAILKKKPEETYKSTDPKTKMPLHLTMSQYKIKKVLDQIVTLGVEKKDGYLTLAVRLPEALAAAQMAQKAQELLQREITKFKIEKTQAELNFIQGRYNVAKAEFENVQVSLASTNDRNRDLTSGLSNVYRDRLQTKYTIAYSVFQDLARQLEQAKIQVKKETPVFTIVEPVTIPTEKSSPNRPMILIIWIFLGGAVGLGIIFGKQYYGKFKDQWALKN